MDEIAKLAGWPAKLVTTALASGMARWRSGMVAAGVRAPAVKPHSEADERREAYGQLSVMLSRTLDVQPHGPGRRLTVEEIREAYPGVKIARKP